MNNETTNKQSDCEHEWHFTATVYRAAMLWNTETWRSEGFRLNADDRVYECRLCGASRNEPILDNKVEAGQ